MLVSWKRGIIRTSIALLATSVTIVSGPASATPKKVWLVSARLGAPALTPVTHPNCSTVTLADFQSGITGTGQPLPSTLNMGPVSSSAAPAPLEGTEVNCLAAGTVGNLTYITGQNSAAFDAYFAEQKRADNASSVSGIGNSAFTYTATMGSPPSPWHFLVVLDGSIIFIWSSGSPLTYGELVTNIVLAVLAGEQVTPGMFSNSRASYTVSVSITGSGHVTSTPSGIMCPPRCHGTFPKGQMVRLHEMTTMTNRFGGWHGSCSGTGNCSLELNSNRAVRAVFRQR